ncbi:MAG: hypothetical protein V3S06_01115 [candidate division Zixibacteria bacterium]
MAAKRFSAIIVISVFIAAIAVWQFQRYRHAERLSTDDDKFVSTYTELAVAREMFTSDRDSLATAQERIFSQNGTDSNWIRQYIENISDNPERRVILWDRIVDRLDSLRVNPIPDTTLKFRNPQQ